MKRPSLRRKRSAAAARPSNASRTEDSRAALRVRPNGAFYTDPEKLFASKKFRDTMESLKKLNPSALSDRPAE